VTDVTIACLSVCLCVWCMLSVTLVHPAKAGGWNEVPFGRDTCVVPGNIVLDGPQVPSWNGEIWGSEHPVCSNAICRQITLALVMKYI